MLDKLSNLLAVLIALSVAAERLVEIVKNLVPYLRTTQTPANAEARRKLVLQLLAAAAGVATAFLAKELLPTPLQNPRHLVLLGLLASGGSGFWTSILGYVNNVKDIKKTKAVGTRVAVAAAVAAVANGTVAHPAAVRTLGATAPTVPQTAAGAAADANLARAIKMANATL
ncbi:MAG: hypothetical protein ACRYFR_19755 [Janthinobacterium lividum]